MRVVQYGHLQMMRSTFGPVESNREYVHIE